MKFLLLFGFFFVAAYAASFEDIFREEWNLFKIRHQKSYDSDTEERYRMKIYAENRYKIAKHNKNYARGMVTYHMRENKYADLLHHEFVHTLNGFNKSINHLLRSNGEYFEEEPHALFLSPENINLPKAIDWREKGYVTPVKDQGHCGSCWSFSATGALEGQHFRKSGKLVSLSEQNLIDCSDKFGNNGCNGGLMDLAFKYIKSNKGIDTEKSYPYEGIDDKCRFKKTNVGADDVGLVDIPSGNEKKLQEAVATVGPVSIAIDASHESFQFYGGGIYNEPECSSEELDHGVLIVGYGHENGADYWLVKNSWGNSWGEEGYIKMVRNKDNHCGVATQASYPLV